MCYIRKRQCNKTGKETFSAPLIFTFIFHEHLKPHLHVNVQKNQHGTPNVGAVLGTFRLSTHNNQHASVPNKVWHWYPNF